VVAVPRSGQELRDLIRTGIEYPGGPFAVRYPRDKAPDVIDWKAEPSVLPIGKWEVLREGRNLAVLCVGTMVEAARRAIATEEFNVTLVNCRFVKPMDEELLKSLLASHEQILTIEEGTAEGGFGTRIALFMQEHGFHNGFAAMHLPDEFVEHGAREKLLELCGLTDAQIAEAIGALLRGEPFVNTAAILAKLPRSGSAS
jgi:1-deoxy-D-xylulose-5-phosphate synthase